ncbi:MAG: TonB-dependent receptor [Bacteroidales bacterium]|nr:TonB-dependent receptor [Bacteroidales bacterium]
MRKILGSIIIVFSISVVWGQADSLDMDALFEMSLEELMNKQVITAAKYVQTTSEAASSISIITAEDIRNYGYSSLDEILNSLKGFYITNDRNYTYIGNRGFSRPSDYNNRILLLLNGHELNENVYGSALLGSELALNMDYIKQIEIVRGPGSCLYGTGAMLNVINIITKDGGEIDGVDVAATFGSYNKKEVAATYGSKFQNGLDFSVSGLLSQNDGIDFYFEELDAPETNNGISEGNDWDKLGGIFSTLKYKDLTFISSFTRRDKGIPTGAWETDLDNKTWSRDERLFAEIAYNKKLTDKSDLKLRSFYDGYHYYGEYPTNDTLYLDNSDGKWVGAEAQYFLSLQKNKMVAGLQYKGSFMANYKYWDEFGNYNFDDNFKYSIFSCYLNDELKLTSKINLSAGLRYDAYSYTGSAITPRLGLIYKIKDRSTIKLLYGEAYRSPNIAEKYFVEENYLKRNPNIKSERINTKEIVFEQQLGHKVLGSLSLYHYKMDNLINQEIDPVDSLVFYQNKGEVTGKGIEMELRFKATKNSSGYINCGIQESTELATDSLNKEYDKELSNSPFFILKAGWSQTIAGVLIVSPEVFYESGRNTVYDTETDPLFLTNINVSSKTFLKYFRVSGKIRNLFDAEYSIPGGFEHASPSIPQNKRSFTIQLSATF